VEVLYTTDGFWFSYPSIPSFPHTVLAQPRLCIHYAKVDQCKVK